eukprot:6978647-Prymnesium_polylepis.1
MGVISLSPRAASSLPHCSALGARSPPGHVGTKASQPLLGTATWCGRAAIYRPIGALFVAKRRACAQPVTPAVADDSPSPHRHHDPIRTS